MTTTSSADQIFEILNLITHSSQPLGAAEISRELSIPLSTVHRALLTLEHTNFLSRFRQTPKFQPGPQATRVSQALYRRWPLHQAAAPVVRELSELLVETVALCVPIGFYTVRILSAPGKGELYVSRDLGRYRLWGEDAVGALFLKNDETMRRRYNDYLRAFGRAPNAASLGQFKEVGIVDAPCVYGVSDVLTLAIPLHSGEDVLAGAFEINFASASLAALEDPKVESAVKLASEFEQVLRDDPKLAEAPFRHIRSEDIVLTV